MQRVKEIAARGFGTNRAYLERGADGQLRVTLCRRTTCLRIPIGELPELRQALADLDWEWRRLDEQQPELGV